MKKIHISIAQFRLKDAQNKNGTADTDVLERLIRKAEQSDSCKMSSDISIAREIVGAIKEATARRDAKDHDDDILIVCDEVSRIILAIGRLSLDWFDAEDILYLQEQLAIQSSVYIERMLFNDVANHVWLLPNKEQRKYFDMARKAVPDHSTDVTERWFRHTSYIVGTYSAATLLVPAGLTLEQILALSGGLFEMMTYRSMPCDELFFDSYDEYKDVARGYMTLEWPKKRDNCRPLRRAEWQALVDLCKITQ